MPFPDGYKKAYEDNLCIHYKQLGTTKLLLKMKRISKNCKLTPQEREVFKLRGALFCVKEIMTSRNIKLAEAMSLFKEARGERKIYKD